MAPELMKDERRGHATIALVDIYSFGLTVYSIFSQLHPYRDPAHGKLSMWTLRDKIVSGSRPSVDGVLDSAPYAAIALMAKCWDDDPDARPASFRDVCKVLVECIEQHAQAEKQEEHKLNVDATLQPPQVVDSGIANPIFQKSSSVRQLATKTNPAADAGSLEATL